MDEDQQLLAKISEISGRINRHKNSSSPQSGPTRPQPWNKYNSNLAAQSRTSSYQTPYSRGSTRVAKPRGPRHRTLVVNNNTPGSSTDEEQKHSMPPNGWVSKRDRHMQLINTNVFDKETQARSKAMAETRRERALKRDQREKRRLEQHLQTRYASPQSSTAAAMIHEITIDGLRFQVLNRGSRLMRIRDTATVGSSTPKQAVVGGVTFQRSKNGNLYRSGIVKAKK
ncbi:MAG: hypothetical protein OHK93_002633 [Ramalina farinacea]|uniref:Uncharacterized protein n=1 Tax=Ramalina farinacea TaxID=258253 RepID=A0AA43QTJ3_9LECA|nr:hypothetical protein [Ramalina farinacea]